MDGVAPSRPPRARRGSAAGPAALAAAGAVAGVALVAGAGLAAALFVGVVAGVLVLEIHAMAKARSSRGR